MNTLVIYFTGLLMLVPDPSGGRMQVLAPAVSRAHPEHVVQIGMFLSASEADCDDYDSENGVCYFNLNEWSLNLFPEREVTDMDLPGGALNLSEEYRRPLQRKYLTEHPSGAVRSRVTLGAGMMTDACALAEWNFGSREIWMTNVVEWTIPDIPATELPLILTRLNHKPWEIWEASRRVLPTLHATDGRMAIIVRQVMREEPEPKERETATHFAEFYRLLGISPPGFLPNRDEENEENAGFECELGTALFGSRIMRALRSPTTYSCMVASGGT